MAAKNTNAKRVIFQPTDENAIKLKQLSEKSGLSVSQVINACLNTIDDVSVYITMMEEKGNVEH